MILLEATFKNNKLEYAFSNKFKETIIKILRMISFEIGEKVKEDELKKENFDELKKENFTAKLIIETDENDEVIIKVDGNEADIYLLINYLLNEIIGKDNSKLLDNLTISADYVIKYENWIKELIKQYYEEVKDILMKKPDIEDETAFIDENQNLVIEVVLNRKKFQFKIPPDKWSF